MRSSLRKAVASVVSAVLVWLSPGVAAYQAWAQPIVEPGASVGRGGIGVTAPVTNVLGTSLPGSAVPQGSGSLLNGSNTSTRFGNRSFVSPAPASGNETPLPAGGERTGEARGEGLTAVESLKSIPETVAEVAQALEQGGDPAEASEKSAKIFEKKRKADGLAVKVGAQGPVRTTVSFRQNLLYKGSKANGALSPIPSLASEGGEPRARKAKLTLLERIADNPKPLIVGASLAAIAVGVLSYQLSPAAFLIPAVALSCASMRSRSIKDATILPNEQDKRRQQLAQKQLDDALVAFGQNLKKISDADTNVKSAVSSHKAEHAAEEPLLDLLPQWKQRLADGETITKEQAYAEARAAILARLKQTTLTADDEKTIAELFDKSGFEKAFQEWEQKWGIVEALRKDAEQKRADKQKQVEVPRAGGNTGQAGGTTLKSLIGFLVAGLSYLTSHVADLLGSMTNLMAEPPAPPVPLDAFLTQAGLNAKEIEFLKSVTSDLGAKETAPVIGRTEEIKKVITILSKPPATQNNPMMLGDKGVGKTAIVEAVAQRLYQNRLPSLKGKRILELDMGALTAGASAVGQLEERLTMLKRVLAKTGNKVVLFIDEIHSILKNNSTSNAVPDLLKSPLRNGEMTVIGATTVGEYRKYMESDPAFSDRFTPVQVDEPTVDEAIEMLLGDQEYLEKKFGVTIEPGAIEAAVKLSARYIPEKFLPRKARVDVLEKALAEVKPEAARDGVQVQIDQLSDRLRIFVKRYAAMKNGRQAAEPGAETQLYNRIVATYQNLISLEERQKTFKARSLTKEDVIRVITEETGIPIGDLGQDEYKKLQTMEPWFKDRIVGQDEAVSAIAETVRANKANLNDPNRPVGSFLFAGKTGVGKTELARTLAEFLFSDKDAVIRLDMSEYMEKFSVQRLFGAPPGYVGYDQGGELTEKVRRKPYSVIVFDEIEKAHPDVLNALLGILDAGRMTDGKGNTVNFKDTIIILTSNIGSESEAEGDQFKKDVVESIRARLRPEFINRIDRTVVFNPLTMDQAERIVSILVRDVAKRLQDQDLELRVTQAAVSQIAMLGFDPRYGARPLKRMVETQITKALGNYLLKKRAEGVLVNGGLLTVDVKDGAVTFDLAPNPAPVVELSPLPEGPLGDKLRRILEEAVRPGSNVTGDLSNFEALLFPERAVIKLTEKLGSFEPETNPTGVPSSQITKSLAKDPEAKDPALDESKAAVRKEFGARWKVPATADAVDAWADGFARVAKRFAVEPKDGFQQRVSFEYRWPASDRDGVGWVGIRIAASQDFQADQKLLKLLKDHFSETLADEAAVREKAARLKDEGKEADLDLLELKRRLDAVPGLRYGFGRPVAGDVVFWVMNDTVAAPKPAETPKAAEPKKDEAPKAFNPNRGAKTAGKTELLGLAGSVEKLLEKATARLPLKQADRDAVKAWLERMDELAGENIEDTDEPTFRIVVDQDDEGRPTGNVTVSMERTSEYDLSDEMQEALEQESVPAGIAGARAGWDTEWQGKESPSVSTIWLQLPVSYDSAEPAGDPFKPGVAPSDQRAETIDWSFVPANPNAEVAMQRYTQTLQRSETDRTAIEALQTWHTLFDELAQKMLLPGSTSGRTELYRTQKGGAQLNMYFDFSPTEENLKVFEDLKQALSSEILDREDVKGVGAQLAKLGVKLDARYLWMKLLFSQIPGAQFGFVIGSGEAGAQRVSFWAYTPRIPPSASAGRLTALDARSSPAKMFLYLTEGYPASLQPLRKLTADMLGSDSSQVRLTALHLASRMLPPAAFSELAAATRLMRLNDARDYELLAELLKDNPAVAMPTQREALAEIFQAQWKGIFGSLSRGSWYVEERQIGNLAAYSTLYARVNAASPDQKEVSSLLSQIERRQSMLKRARVRYSLATAASLALGLLAWSRFDFAFAAGWPIGIAIGVAAAIIAIWVNYNGRYEGAASAIRRTLPALKAFLMPLLGPDGKARVARAMLSDRQIPAGVKVEDFLRLLESARPALDAEGGVDALFASWLKDLSSRFDKEKKSNSGYDSARMSSINLLGHLYAWVPAERRAEATRLLLEPMRRRWRIDDGYSRGSSGYLASLNAWLRDAALTPQELEDITGLMSRWLQQTTGPLALLATVGGKPGLSPAARNAIDDMARSAAASADDSSWLNLMVVRARLGYGAEVWKAFKERAEKDSRYLNYWFAPLTELLRVSPPQGADAKWFQGWLERQKQQNQDDAQKRRFDALLDLLKPKSGAERLPALLRAVQDGDAEVADRLSEVRRIASDAMANEEKAAPGKMTGTALDQLEKLTGRRD